MTSTAPHIASPAWQPSRPGIAPTYLQLSRLHLSAGILIIALHIPLALFMFRFPQAATAHAMASALVGVTILFRKKYVHLAYLAAYIAGSEILWRMCGAQIFYETGKYLPSFLCLFALVRLGKLRGFGLPLTYFALLTPSIIYTLDILSLGMARRAISFNLSGPFALMVAVVFFSNMTLSEHQLRRLLLWFSGPVIGIFSCAAYSTIIAGPISFSSDSNMTTSGGFGPNQVSSIMGLAILTLCFFSLIAFNRRKYLVNPFSKVFFIGFIPLLLIQCLLTFSRSGITFIIISLVLGCAFLIRDAGSRRKFLGITILGGFMLFVFVVPKLQDLTGGALGERYTDTSTTGRLGILHEEIAVWRENFFLGVGPGIRPIYRSSLRGSSAHTEYSRMLAEHGLLGLISMLILAVLAIQSFLKSSTPFERGFRVSLLTWSLLFWTVNGMRIFAPEFMFGLAFLTVHWQKPKQIQLQPNVPIKPPSAVSPQEPIPKSKHPGPF